jgi:hypothetical protein
MTKRRGPWIVEIMREGGWWGYWAHRQKKKDADEVAKGIRSWKTSQSMRNRVRVRPFDPNEKGDVWYVEGPGKVLGK